MLITWWIIGILLNMLLGAFIWALVDKDGRYFTWYDSAPPAISWFTQPLILMLWPVALYVLWKERKNE